MSDEKKIWMVRIESQICGPYETSTVEKLILEEKVSEVDEVALPCKTWCYVRDRAEFAEIFKKIQSNSSVKSRSSLSSKSFTGTEDITDIMESERTKELKLSEAKGTGTNPVIEFNNLKVNSKNLNTRQGFVKPPKKKKNISLIVILGMIFIALGGYFFGFNKLAYNPLELFTGETQKNLDIAWASGDYEKAFKAIQTSKGFLKKYRNKYAALLLMRGNKFNLAEKNLDLASNKVSLEWKNLKGLSEQYRGRLDLAESYFLSVLKENQNYTPSLINLGLLKRQEGDWSLALSYFEAAFSRVKGSGFDDVSFYLLEAWTRQLLAESGVTDLDNIVAYLNNQMVGHSTYIHEFKLVELWINVVRSSWTRKEEILTKEILNLDPAILVERKVNPYTYKLPPGAISYICEDLNLKLTKTKYKKSVVALCLIVNKEYGKATSMLKKDIHSEYAMTLYSFAAKLNKDFLKADEQLEKAMGIVGGENYTKFFFQARFCYEKGNMKCAAEYWMKGLDRDSQAYTAYTGLALSYFQVRDYKKAKVFMKRAKKFAKSYGPLIELQLVMKDIK